MADNWYLILELEFDPPIEDERIIEERIEKKRKEWTKDSQHFVKGAMYRQLLDALPQIKADMLGENNIRKQLAEEAERRAYAPIDKLVKMIGRKGYITAEEGSKISSQKKLDINLVKKRAEKFGIEWRGTVTNYKAIYDKHYVNPPHSSAAYSQIEPLLEALKKETVYEFLCPEGQDLKDFINSGRENIADRVESKRKEFKKNDAVSGTGKKLCGACKAFFKDDKSKEEYDQYVAWKQKKKILDEVKEAANVSGRLYEENWNDFIGKLTYVTKNRELSKEILTAFCEVENILYHSEEESPQQKKKYKECRCGYINDISDGRTVCQNCGLELIIRCPKCGAENDANIKVCKCGFPFENIDKAFARCNLAEHAVNTLDFDTARTYLEDADRYWPGNNKTAGVRKLLASAQQRAGDEVSRLHTAFQKKRYCETQRRYTGLQKLFPGFKELEMERTFSEAIAKAESFYQQAQSAKKEKEIIEFCTKAYETCKDLVGVRELMEQYPPKAPQDLKVRADGNTRANILIWNAGEEKESVYYSIVRKKDAMPLNAFDGEVLGRVSMCSFNDRNIVPGDNYYYAIFAERAGIYSQPIQTEQPIVNLFEIIGVAVAAGDCSLQISWESLPENAEAEIIQIEDGHEKKIATSHSNGYLISGLQNDRKYSYRIAVAYMVNGVRRLTKGVMVTGVPTCPPQPVDIFRVYPDQNDRFLAIWSHSGEGEVRLYAATTKPACSYGEILSTAALEKKMTPLQCQPLRQEEKQKLRTNESGVSFKHGGAQLLYVAAVVVKAGSAIFGAVARATKDDAVTVKDIRPVNGTIHIFIDPPKEASGFVVLYRFDQYPTEIGDLEAKRKYVPLKQYKNDNAIVLDTLEQKDYYFSVFAEFKRDGEKDYSAGSDYLFRNKAKEQITYSVSVAKKRFGESSVFLEFESENENFLLPDITIMSAVGNAPMFKSSAKLFYEIESQPVQGSLQVRIPLPKNMAKNTYIKAFFKEESAQAANQLRLKVKSSYKIS